MYDTSTKSFEIRRNPNFPKARVTQPKPMQPRDERRPPQWNCSKRPKSPTAESKTSMEVAREMAQCAREAAWRKAHEQEPGFWPQPSPDEIETFQPILLNLCKTSDLEMSNDNRYSSSFEEDFRWGSSPFTPTLTLAGIDAHSAPLAEEERPEVKFKTGSSYKGHWNALGMAGHGRYKMFQGVEYDGTLKDGMFHGKGSMWYPNNCRVQSTWKKGMVRNLQHFFVDGLNFTTRKNWHYLSETDKRFMPEMLQGIKPTGRTALSDKTPPRMIPPGCFDTGDGFYDPRTKCVMNATTGEIIRIPPLSEAKWIMGNCRQSEGLPHYTFKKTESELFDTKKLQEQLFSKEPSEDEEEDEEVWRGEDLVDFRGKQDKCVGRYDVQVTQGEGEEPFRFKYVVVDERKRACPKSDRLLLPVSACGGRFSIVPEVSVEAPAGCVHEHKTVLANKLLLLIKIFGASSKAGGPEQMDNCQLKEFQRDFEDILGTERFLGRDTDSSYTLLPELETVPSLTEVLRVKSVLFDASEDSEEKTQRERVEDEQAKSTTDFPGAEYSGEMETGSLEHVDSQEFGLFNLEHHSMKDFPEHVDSQVLEPLKVEKDVKREERERRSKGSVLFDVIKKDSLAASERGSEQQPVATSKSPSGGHFGSIHLLGMKVDELMEKGQEAVELLLEEMPLALLESTNIESELGQDKDQTESVDDSRSDSIESSDVDTTDVEQVETASPEVSSTASPEPDITESEVEDDVH